MGSGFRKIHQTKDSILKHENYFVNRFWQLDPTEPPNHMPDKAISMISND